jgi:hypothetical protein
VGSLNSLQVQNDPDIDLPNPKKKRSCRLGFIEIMIVSNLKLFRLQQTSRPRCIKIWIGLKKLKEGLGRSGGRKEKHKTLTLSDTEEKDLYHI